MPRISIIVPVYNVEKYLNKCIESILSQSFTDFELLLIDDGSTDSSGKICDEYAAKYDHIVVIHKENGGVSSARNLGLSLAQGEYVGFIDSDDYVDSEMYKTLFENIEHYKADISICGFKVIDEDINKVERVQDSGKLTVLDQKGLVACETDMPWSIRLDTINKLFRKKAIDGLRFDETLKCAEDTLFLHQAIMKMKKGVFIEKPFYINIRHAGSAMRGRLNPIHYYESYYIDERIYQDIKKNYSDLEWRSYLVLLNNCIWKLEDVCKNLKGRATVQDKQIIKKMRKFMCRIGTKVLFCKEIGIKQRIGLFLLATSVKDRNLHFV